MTWFIFRSSVRALWYLRAAQSCQTILRCVYLLMSDYERLNSANALLRRMAIYSRLSGSLNISCFGRFALVIAMHMLIAREARQNPFLLRRNLFFLATGRCCLASLGLWTCILEGIGYSNVIERASVGPAALPRAVSAARPLF